MTTSIKKRPKHLFILYFLCLVLAEIIIRNFFTRTFNYYELDQLTFLDKYLKTIILYLITAFFCYLLKYSIIEVFIIIIAFFLCQHNTLLWSISSVDSEYQQLKLAIIYFSDPLFIALIWTLCRTYFIKDLNWKKLLKLFFHTQLSVLILMLASDFLLNHLFKIYYTRNILKILLFNMYWAFLGSIPFFLFILGDFYRQKWSNKITIIIHQISITKGRMNRSNYTFCTILLILTGFAIRNLHNRLSFKTGLFSVPENSPEIIIWLLFVCLMLSITTLLFIITIKRLRDLDVEGFGSILLLLIPLANLFYIIYLMIKKGENKKTYYGQPDNNYIIKKHKA